VKALDFIALGAALHADALDVGAVDAKRDRQARWRGLPVVRRTEGDVERLRPQRADPGAAAQKREQLDPERDIAHLDPGVSILELEQRDLDVARERAAKALQLESFAGGGEPAGCGPV
jgi:hypothetical protein